MSKGLEALEKIRSKACSDRDELFCLKHLNCKKSEENEAYYPYCNGCLYCSGNENYKIIEKELKALEIIKNKQIDIWQLRLCMSFNLTMTKEEQLNEYNKRHATFLHLTQEEFDLLKEVLL